MCTVWSTWFFQSLLQTSTTEVALPPSNFYDHFSNIGTNAIALSYRAVSYRAGSSWFSLPGVWRHSKATVLPFYNTAIFTLWREEVIKGYLIHTHFLILFSSWILCMCNPNIISDRISWAAAKCLSVLPSFLPSHKLPHGTTGCHGQSHDNFCCLGQFYFYPTPLSASFWTRKFAARSPGWQQPSLPSHCKWKSDTPVFSQKSLFTLVSFLLIRFFTVLSKYLTYNLRRKIYFGSWFKGTPAAEPHVLARRLRGRGI